MLTCSHLPPMFRYHHGPWNRSTLPRLHLPMVRSTNQNDKRSRSQVHLTIRQSAHRKTQDPTKSIYGIPSPNRRVIRTKEPMDRTISTTGNLERPQGMDALAHTCNNSTQQPDQYNHRTISQPNPLRIQPHTQLRQSVTNP